MVPIGQHRPQTLHDIIRRGPATWWIDAHGDARRLQIAMGGRDYHPNNPFLTRSQVPFEHRLYLHDSLGSRHSQAAFERLMAHCIALSTRLLSMGFLPTCTSAGRDYHTTVSEFHRRRLELSVSAQRMRISAYLVHYLHCYYGWAGVEQIETFVVSNWAEIEEDMAYANQQGIGWRLDQHAHSFLF